MSHNQFQFIGNLTRDVDLRQSENGGKSFALIDIATNRAWYGSDEKLQKETDYFRLKVFGSAADRAAQYLKKGSQAFFQGRIKPTKYEKDGKTEYGTDFIVEIARYL